MTDKTPSQAGRIALGALCAIAIGLIVFFFLPDPAPDPATGAGPVSVAVPQVSPETVSTAAPAPVVSTVPPSPSGPEPSMAPRFDTFRVEPDGAMLIAGRTRPDQQVALVLGGKVIESVAADAVGSFVIFAQAGPSDVPRRLSLLGDPEGAAIPSQTSYMVAPIRTARVVETPAAPRPVAPPVVPDIALDIPVDAPDVDAAVPALSDVAEPPAAPTVLQADAEGIRVVQSARESIPNVALDAITYDPDGDIRLSGRATGVGAVQVYLDNRPVTSSPVNIDGDWRIDLPPVDTGIYTLRIDEVNNQGAVVSRIETPFKREEASDVAAVLAEQTARDGFEVAVRTVQPGATLWAIAEENLGKGIYYVAVFEANRDLIKDPDLIYPGQIFRIPAHSE
ncbi:LysM peptidoglycan-binding domain-containing protein [Yoonia sp.]|uniref:LysM peptidoglycan-binding domain-containing protein n=1 Tax=Yoonia sp. TaxID=2212373 RepID=UPI003F6B245B